ncbi:hypothetical protein HA402_005172 [Bradysia odoriphaga]|nr:hypothetical protein HA402_005172 [Bradysia odoriphaga]
MAGNQSTEPNKSDEWSIQLLISDNNDWTDDGTFSRNGLAYRAEGNANLVVSINQRRQILRLLKVVKECNDGGRDDTELKKLQQSLAYVKLFTLLLTDEFTVIPQIAEVIINDYDAFNRWLLPYRPEERTVKEVRCRYGLLYPDVAFMPDRLSLNKSNELWNGDQDTYCIEIKPKQGWTLGKCNPNPFPGIDLNGIDKCRYCAMQYWKLTERKIQRASQYCPIDLFSGYSNRMHRAIKGLIEEPQNNFRLCKNGQLVFDNNTESSAIHSIVGDIFKQRPSVTLDDFVDLILLMLIKDFNKIEQDGGGISKTHNNDRKCAEPTKNALPANSILKQILDIQLLSKSYVWSIDDFKETHSNAPSQCANKGFTKRVADISNSRSVRENFFENLSKTECYTLGATALDCSIMLTFQWIYDTDTDSITHNIRKHIISHGRDKFLVNATAVDVDPKTPEHFVKYIKQTNASHKAYRGTLNNELESTDGKLDFV